MQLHKQDTTLHTDLQMFAYTMDESQIKKPQQNTHCDICHFKEHRQSNTRPNKHALRANFFLFAAISMMFVRTG